MARKGLKGQGRDEFLGMFRHHHHDGNIFFRQQSYQFGRLVRGDTAGDAENRLFSCRHLFRPLPIGRSFTATIAIMTAKIKVRNTSFTLYL